MVGGFCTGSTLEPIASFGYIEALIKDDKFVNHMKNKEKALSGHFCLDGYSVFL
jgi:hypothetical protein